MSNNAFSIAFLHSVGFTQKDFFRADLANKNATDFFENCTLAMLMGFWITEERAKKIIQAKEKLQKEEIMQTIERLHIQIMVFWSEEYPQELTHLSHPPFVLYVRGKIPNFPKLAVVGSRKSTVYSEKIIAAVVPTLVGHNYAIVSGWAYGVDTLAHKQTLKSGGQTIAVFGTGIDVSYPAQNVAMFEEIAKTGALLSQFPIGASAEAFHFPARNEIIAGLCRWVIITEAGEKSGTLITARLALDLNRDVFAFPGDVFRWESFGTNAVIRDGEAKLVTTAEDILSEYENGLWIVSQKTITEKPNGKLEKKTTAKIISAPPKTPASLTEDEKTVWNILTIEWVCTADVLSEKTNLANHTLLAILSVMEISGHIRRDMFGGYFI